MKERPILFNSDMVRAILDDRKTQTRRIIKNPSRLEGLMLKGEESEWCPYGVVGDRLWVKETFRYAIFALGCGGHASGVEYKMRGIRFDKRAKKYAKQRGNKDKYGQHAKWRSPRFMPKWAARLWLEITGIRVERVQEIGLRDCLAEGIEGQRKSVEQLRSDFWRLWDSLNAKHSWKSNPWVWVIEFKRVPDEL